MDRRIIINIGRQFCSGGRQVALILGRKLDIPVFDNELLAEAAAQSGFSKELFALRDEKHRIFSLSNMFGSNRYGKFTTSFMNDTDLFKIQSDVICDIASRQSAIFVGRAADYILRDIECLNVFISASMEDRKRAAVERGCTNMENAEDFIRRKDRERQNYYNFVTFGEWGMAHTYDLCLNSSLLGVEGSADFIIEFAKRRGMLG